MVNLRSRSKAKVVAPRATQKMEPTTPAPFTRSDDLNLSEEALRKLPRAELQKLAMAHKVKANMKSELIIRELSSLQIPKKTRRAEDDPEEGTSQKRIKREDVSGISITLTRKNQTALEDAQPVQNTSVWTSAENPQAPEAGPSALRSTSPVQKVPIALPYDKDLFSGTESEMTEEEQFDFATPISSRSETPPAANVNDLMRCVTIMQQISAQDVELLNEVTSVRETGAKLRKRARDIRDLVKAETGRRERMEAYFRYWQEIEPTWDRQWLYRKKTPPNEEESDKPAELPTSPVRQKSQRPGTPAPGRKPALSPEELKRKRAAIISKQEAEQHQLEALQRWEMQGKIFSREGSSEAVDEDSLGGADLPSNLEENGVIGPLIVSGEDRVGTIALPEPSR